MSNPIQLRSREEVPLARTPAVGEGVKAPVEDRLANGGRRIDDVGVVAEVLGCLPRPEVGAGGSWTWWRVGACGRASRSACSAHASWLAGSAGTGARLGRRLGRPSGPEGERLAPLAFGVRARRALEPLVQDRRALVGACLTRGAHYLLELGAHRRPRRQCVAHHRAEEYPGLPARIRVLSDDRCERLFGHSDEPERVLAHADPRFQGGPGAIRGFGVAVAGRSRAPGLKELQVALEARPNTSKLREGLGRTRALLSEAHQLDTKLVVVARPAERGGPSRGLELRGRRLHAARPCCTEWIAHEQGMFVG